MPRSTHKCLNFYYPIVIGLVSVLSFERSETRIRLLEKLEKVSEGGEVETGGYFYHPGGKLLSVAISL